MMKNTAIAFLGLAILLLSSCRKTSNDISEQKDYIIFGHFYGMCEGEECVETFKLTADKLYEDVNDDYTGEERVFTELGTDKFQLVSDLIEQVPQDLLDSEASNFGCPDCADQGGIFIELLKNGSIRRWRIHQSKSSVPEYLHDFIDEINSSIESINN